MDPSQSRPDAARRASHRLRFALERFVLRGLGHRLLLAAAIVVAVALVAGGLVALLDPGLSEPGEAIWWAFLRLTDPGYLGDDDGVARRAISTIVTVLGYVLFLGLLIAILTQWLNQLIQKLESAVTPIALRDHVVVVGWSRRVPAIVEELLRTRHRVQRFLARHGARELRIVVLAEHVDAALIEEVRERLGPLWDDRRTLIRSGSPLRLEHLERVAFLDAAVLILPGAEHAERNPDAVDARTLKTLVAVSNHAREVGAPPPLAVAEVFDGRRADLGRRAYAAESEILAVDEIVARLIAQSVWQRGLGEVFSELLTLNVGNAVYVRSAAEEAGTAFSELQGAYSRAVPLGVVRSGEARPVLVPDPGTEIEAGDLLVFLAEHYDDCRRDALPGGRLASAPSASPHRLAERRRRLLVLGWSRKLPALLRELARYGTEAFEVDVVSSTPLSERQKLLEQHEADVDALRVRQLEASYSVPGVLGRLAPRAYDNVVVLASERLEDEGQADATSVAATLMLRDLLPLGEPRPEILIELLDEENLFLVDREREDVIVSPQVVSYLLSQVALRRELSAIFEELSRARGAQLVLQPAKAYLGGEGPVGFAEVEQLAASRGEIGLGLRLAREGLLLNPDRSRRFELAESDQVVILRSVVEGAEAR